MAKWDIEKDVLPSFSDFPLDKDHPPLAAWSLWGKDDQYGTLNLLTPARVKEASSLVKSGDIFPLNWKLELPNPPLFHRSVLKHEVIRTVQEPAVFDDVYHNFNTQTSTQWDCFHHFAGHLGEPAAGSPHKNTFYQGKTPEDVPNLPGVAAWAQRGIAGRAVLLDYRRWALKNGIQYSPGTNHEITLANLKKVAEDQGVTFKTGDILLIRSGWIEWYESLSQVEREKYAAITEIEIAGLENTVEMLQWLWNNHFGAVAGDQTALECVGPLPEGSKSVRWLLHLHLLSQWGSPIGEMFYLEKLADACAKNKRWEFFFTSAPLNKEHGIASPPNAIAIL
ncbi:hypothetical protein M427DRAFT_53999 [Gonapodya prolifera JEL478]|uniref:Cyclase n=1 Tax=Gonapodya prolifera (strain JEL478) TaxID=1344416 RepID=A0A139AN47_GONPJ|nr:hypothetical protein M427DRAFT_53999 [Gonapodya prolifera JEL478]|eukprot:KXS18166.1 hypothetical protein M427DRAFT_53999 [Gonapodya prolifera JEL478]